MNRDTELRAPRCNFSVTALGSVAHLTKIVNSLNEKRSHMTRRYLVHLAAREFGPGPPGCLIFRVAGISYS
jgi:hypothetical protein